MDKVAYAKLRRALPWVQELSREVVRDGPLETKLNDDCRAYINKFLAAESLKTRFRMFEIEHWDDVQKEAYTCRRPPRIPQESWEEMVLTLDVLGAILLFDVYDNNGPRDQPTWWVGVGSSNNFGEPHYFGKPERRRARMAEGWCHPSACEPNPFRYADALDLADPWQEGKRRYGADRIRRNLFRSLHHCHEWWAGLLSPLVLHVMQDAGAYGHRPVHVPRGTWPWVDTKPKLPPSLELTEMQQVKIASWPHRVRYVDLPHRRRLAPETKAWFDREILEIRTSAPEQGFYAHLGLPL